MAIVKKPVAPVKTVTGKTTPAPKQEVHQPSSADLAFGKENYMLMLIGIAIIVIGFMLMSGGKLDDPSAFNPEIFSFRRITLAPIVVMLGFALEVYAIVKKSKE